MKLNKEHIVELYKFTQQHFVEWYDLQTELVDHLANDIENICEENPNLSFDEAKNKAFKKFGIIGFNDVIQEKEKALRKKYWKMVWQIFKVYFKIPQIILTVLLVVTTYTILNLIQNKWDFLFSYFILSIIISFYFFFNNLLKINKKNKITGKKWTFEQIYPSMGGAIFLINIIFQIIIVLQDQQTWSIYYQFASSLFIALFSLFLYIVTQIIPPKIKETMTKQYPEYKLYHKV